jgi:hypothetical protein
MDRAYNFQLVIFEAMFFWSAVRLVLQVIYVAKEASSSNLISKTVGSYLREVKNQEQVIIGQVEYISADQNVTFVFIFSIPKSAQTRSLLQSKKCGNLPFLTSTSGTSFSGKW